MKDDILSNNVLKDEIFKYFKGKKISLLGFGRSNYSISKIFDKCGIDFKILDKTDRFDKINEFKNSKVEYLFGEDYLSDISNCDIVFRSPGIKYNDEMKNAVKNGVKFTSEISFFYKFCRSKNIFAITGSDGKTTSSNIIYEILKKSGKKVFLGGNVGIPVSSYIFEILKDDFIVLELSSFQLFDCKIRAKVSLITNISENHLDWHTNFEEYTNTKSNIFKNQNYDDLLVLNYDDKYSSYMKNKAKSKIRFFSLKNKLSNGTFLDDNQICFSENGNMFEVIDINNIKIPGMHNVENFMSAISCCFDFVSIDDIRYVCKNFSGVKHRIEFVSEINGVKYFDDSIASTPNRVIKGSLSLFKNNIILIAGGYDKKLDFKEFADCVCKKVKSLILMGQTANKIEKCVLESNVKTKPKIVKVSSMYEAVLESYRNSSQNDVVLLSPSCASFGMYNDFEERGNDFKKCVLKLKNSV